MEELISTIMESLISVTLVSEFLIKNDIKTI